MTSQSAVHFFQHMNLSLVCVNMLLHAALSFPLYFVSQNRSKGKRIFIQIMYLTSQSQSAFYSKFKD